MLGAVIVLVSVIATVWTPVTSQNTTSIVQTNSGPIRGEENKFDGTNYKVFKGIPYAAPPVGNLRFKPPQPPQEWTDVRDTTSFSKACPQDTRSVNATSEDCLTLNVYTQSIDENDLKPVLVWIHGGAFMLGSGPTYGPEYLIRHNIVVVTINYRLGPLGFLAINTSEASGNWGLKDQVAAMKWVQANIARFGGDPKQVTIYGESAGGASVHFHLFSPLSKGLFQKAILSSGSAVNIWSVKGLDEADRYSSNLALHLGATDEEVANPQKRLEFLQAADANKMIKQYLQDFRKEEPMHLLFKRLPFTPVIEAPNTEGAFLVEDPKKLLADGRFTKVPMMVGLNDLEGALIYIGFGRNFTPEVKRKIEQNVCEILPQALKDAVIAKNECSQVAQRIRDAYFGGNGFDSSDLNFVYMWGDLFILNDVYFSQKTHAKYSGEENPLYNYYFTFEGEWNWIKTDYKIPLPGAGHADELYYIFKTRRTNNTTASDSSQEVITRNRMTSFISNFVKNGNPTPPASDFQVKWEPSKEKEYSTMVIGNELKLQKEFLKTRMGLWDQLNEIYLQKV